MSAATVQAQPTGPALLRLAAARLVEARGSRPVAADVQAAIRAAVSDAAPLANVRVLADEVWDLVEVRLDRSGWPYFRTVGGMAAELRFMADFYDRELAAAVP